MALTRTLLYLALALAVVCSIEATWWGSSSEESSDSSSEQSRRGNHRESSESSQEGSERRGQGRSGGSHDSSDSSHDSSEGSHEGGMLGRIRGHLMDHFRGRSGEHHGSRSDEHHRGESGERHGDRHRNVPLACWVQNATSTQTFRTANCSNYTSCDTEDTVTVSDPQGTDLFRVGFCKLNVTAWMIYLGSGECTPGEDEGCSGPFAVGDSEDLHFCSSGERFNISTVSHPCRRHGDDHSSTRSSRSSTTTTTTQLP